MLSLCPECSRPLEEGAASCVNCAATVAGPGLAPATLTPPTRTAIEPAELDSPPLPERFRVERFLGKGAMGRVYRCRDTTLNVDVAVKVLPLDLSGDAEAIEALKAEAQNAARVRDDPGILALHDLGFHAGRWYLVMDLAEGGSLKDLLAKEGPLPEARCRAIGAAVARSLAHAHRQKILHRDIKPENVLLTTGGRTKVADFGIAKTLADAQTRRSAVMTIAGTPPYMAPEIFLQQASDHRADLYSLGVMLFELASGKRPFSGSIVDICMQKVQGNDPAPLLREMRPELSAEFVQIVQRLLSREPAGRFSDGETCALALDGLEKDTVLIRAPEPEPGPDSAPASARRFPVGWIVGGALALAGAGVLFVILNPGKPDPGTGGSPPAPAKSGIRSPPDAGKTPEKGPDPGKPDGSPVPPAPGPGADPSPTPAPTPVPAPAPASPPSLAEALHLSTPPSPAPASLGLPQGIRRAGDRLFSDVDGAELVFVPEGEFTMGSAGEEKESPVRKVKLRGYLIDRHEVTVRQYRAFCDANARTMPGQPGASDLLPVVGVRWEDAEAYAKWARRALPTEAQWEKAARGEGAGGKFPWGATDDERKRNGSGRLTAPGTFPAGVSPCGCLDMAGNAAEWCADYFAPYAVAFEPGGPPGGSHRIVRGGHCLESGDAFRCSARSSADPGTSTATRGFRCAVEIP